MAGIGGIEIDWTDVAVGAWELGASTVGAIGTLATFYPTFSRFLTEEIIFLTG